MSFFHNIYLNKGNLAVLPRIDKTIYATIISYVIQKLLMFAFFNNSNIIKMKYCEIKNNSQIVSNIYRHLTIKHIMFFCLIILISILSWFYIGCFCCFFPKTQIYLLIVSIISIIISFIFSLIILVISGYFRFYSLNEPGRDNIYELSQFLQII